MAKIDTPDDLLRRVRRHNALQIGIALFLAPASVALWILSFWIFRCLFAIPLDVLGLPGWKVGFYLAWGSMAVLAVEGFRYKTPLFDLAEYSRSGYYDNFVMRSESGYALSRYYGNPLGYAYFVSQTLFCAPHSAVLAVKAFRSRLPSDEQTLAAATRILGELRQSRKWVPASTYADSGAALLLLDQLDLIWVRTKTGEVEIRYPAGVE